MKKRMFIFRLLTFIVVLLPISFSETASAASVVRLIYLHPKDRVADLEKYEDLRQYVKETHQFFAEEMERHGHGRKTFELETDPAGEVVVHRVTGRFAGEYYTRFTGHKAWEEIREHFGFDELHHIYLIAVDLSDEYPPWEGKHCGEAGVNFLASNGIPRRRSYSMETQGEEILGGFAVVPASGHCLSLKLIAHELGHAFGLAHDFREGRHSDYVMAYGSQRRLSVCTAEWLSVSRFFSKHPRVDNPPGRIQMISAPAYTQEGIRFRFQVADADGLHQAQLLLSEPSGEILSVCKQLEGETQTVDFISPELTRFSFDTIMLQLIDAAGNITWSTIQIDIADLLPPSKVASLKKPGEVGTDIPRQSVPTTGTYFVIHNRLQLARNNFTIGPGEFAILAHNGRHPIIKQADFKTYDAYQGIGNNARDIPNLAHFFQQGGRIELISHATANPLPSGSSESQFGDIVISEIMWGLDGTSPAKQYIELYNASAHAYTFMNGDVSLRFSTVSQEPLPNEVFAPPPPFNPTARVKVIDRVSNAGWRLLGKNGNISQNEPLISMYRTIDYTTGDVPDGTLASSWKASTGRVNLSAPSYGTPGAKHLPPRPVVLVAVSQRSPMYWIDADAGTLHRLIGDVVENLLPNVQNATSLAVDMAGGKLYWTEKTGERTGRIRGASLDGTNVQLVKTLTSVPHGIALDAVNGKIYLTNGWGKVQRLNVDGSNFQANLITGLNMPNDIVVDSTGSKIYWIEQTSERRRRIQCANLNGSNVQLVKALTSQPLGIALDPSRNKIYVTNAYGKVQRLSTNGSDFQPNFITGLDTPKDVAVDVAHSKLYWTEKGSIWRADLNGDNIQEVITGVGSPGSIVLGTSSMPPVERAPPTEPVTYAATDVNQDKKVNKTDLLLVVTALGEKPPTHPESDVNADGTVNIADVLLVIEDLDDPVAAAAPVLGETAIFLDPGRLAMQIEILRVESDGSRKYEYAIAFLQSLLAAIHPTETRLLANYPNPFNPETWIPYQLSKDSPVSISIYDPMGQLVRTLSIGFQSAGFYNSRGRAAYWDGLNALGERVASGLYFYQLTTPTFQQTRRMLILK